MAAACLAAWHGRRSSTLTGNPPLVASFYERIWNAGDGAAVPELLSTEFAFRGSLGTQLTGHAAFWEYVCGIRAALDHYRCEILECVSEGERIRELWVLGDLVALDALLKSNAESSPSRDAGY